MPLMEWNWVELTNTCENKFGKAISPLNFFFCIFNSYLVSPIIVLSEKLQKIIFEQANEIRYRLLMILGRRFD